MKISFLKNNNDIKFFLSAINKPAPNNIVVEKSNQSYTVSWNRVNTSHTELKTIAVYWCHGDRRSHFCKVCEQRKPCILENMYCLTRLYFNRLWDNLFVIFFLFFFFFLNCKIHQYRIEYNNIITYKTSYNLYSKVQLNLLTIFSII